MHCRASNVIQSKKRHVSTKEKGSVTISSCADKNAVVASHPFYHHITMRRTITTCAPRATRGAVALCASSPLRAARSAALRTSCAQLPFRPSLAHTRMFFWLVGFGAVGGSALGGLAHHRRPWRHPSLWRSCAIGGLAGAGFVITPLGLLSVLDGGFWGALSLVTAPAGTLACFQAVKTRWDDAAAVPCD